MQMEDATQQWWQGLELHGKQFYKYCILTHIELIFIITGLQYPDNAKASKGIYNFASNFMLTYIIMPHITYLDYYAHRAEALGDDARLTFFWRVHRA